MSADNGKGTYFPLVDAKIEKGVVKDDKVVTWWGCKVKGEWRNGIEDGEDQYAAALRRVLSILFDEQRRLEDEE